MYCFHRLTVFGTVSLLLTLSAPELKAQAFNDGPVVITQSGGQPKKKPAAAQKPKIPKKQAPRAKHPSAPTRRQPAPRPVALPPPPLYPTFAPDGTPITEAAAVLVADALSGQVLLEKNATEYRQPASTQKLLTALLIIEDGNLDRSVVIQESDTRVEPTRLGVRPGDVYTRRELLRALLIHSTNDAALALARDNAGSVEAFVRKMNEKAQQLGMRHSHFANPNGLPAPGQYSTARDLARLGLTAYRSATLRRIVATKEMVFQFSSGKVELFKNTNEILRAQPWCNGMKTGYTAGAGHCLISSGARDGREIITVVLGNRSRSWLWHDSSVLLEWGLGR